MVQRYVIILKQTNYVQIYLVFYLIYTTFAGSYVTKDN